MKKASSGQRCVVTAGLLFLVGWASESAAGASQATKDRCTRYAQRAVQQYRLMTSHPECEVKNDPLTWQDSYDNHYNGCLIFPESMAKLGEQARDNHLQACGALGDGSTAGSAAVPGKGVKGTPTAAVKPAAAEAGSSAAPVANPATAVPGGGARADCRIQRPAALPIAQTKVGFGATVNNGTLSFHSSAQQGELQSYGVIRPAYFAQELACTGRADDRYGPWITLVGEKGAEILRVGEDDTVFAAPLTADAAQQLLTK